MRLAKSRPGHPGLAAARNLLFSSVTAAIAIPCAQAAPVDYPTPIQNMTFSIDNQGPIVQNLILDSFYGITILGSDILTPYPPGPPGPNPPADGPLPPPGEVITNPPRGNGTIGFEVVPPSNGLPELDALSYGHDPIDVPFPDQLKHSLYYVFSVDEFAIGLPGTDVRVEGAIGNQEASADTFIIEKPSPLPAPPGTLGTNYAFTDGDGVAPSGQPGVGLIEPNPPTVRSVPDPGDNLDAVDFDTTIEDLNGPVFFSLDSAFPDPLEAAAAPPNYGTALANGVVGGDVLVGSNPTAAGAPFSIYAPAVALGLDLFGHDTDDLDALKLWENGIDGYQVSLVPFDWLDGSTDMLLFSVRRGSALIGQLDSIWGFPIEEGDILTAPCAAGSILPDGTICVGGSNPGIFTAAEQIGLATVRSGTAMSWSDGAGDPIINPVYGANVWADDLDALDQKVLPVPAPLALMLAGIAGLGVARRRRRSA